jgi:threonine/homoserine/homoserine lactone efflux protein
VTDLYVWVVGMALGFSLVIPPGPMNALIAVRSVRSLPNGISTGLGAMSADLILGALVYALHTLVDLTPVVRWVEACGAAVMAYFAYRVFTRETRTEPPPPGPNVRVFSEALLVGGSNPFQVLWWLTVGLTFAYLGGILLLAGLFAAIGVWIVVFPYSLHRGARRFARGPRLVALVSGGLLVGFAGYCALLAAGILR